MDTPNIDNFKALFPLKGNITQEIIDNHNNWDFFNCTGAETLKNALPDEFKDLVTWGVIYGFVEVDGYEVRICTEESINMMATRYPQKVTFYIYNIKKI